MGKQVSTMLIRVNAGNDRNGNPRRGWVVVAESDGMYLGFVDHGYAGWGNVRAVGLTDGREVGCPFTKTGDFSIPVSTYRDLLKRSYPWKEDE